MTESAEQQRVVEWCRVTDWQAGKTLGIGRIFHIPNGGWRSKSEAARMKAAGVVPGVADLFVPVPVHDADGRMVRAGLWIEMKAQGGRLDAKQGEWLDSMRHAGYGAVVAFGADEAIAAIKEYLADGGIELN